jgi:hypothetical protein
MAYIELVDSPKKLGKCIKKRERVYPTIKDLHEKVPVMTIYNKPVVHVSENKNMSFMGGILLLLNRMHSITIPTVEDFANKMIELPDVSIEFVNITRPSQPGEAEAHAAIYFKILQVENILYCLKLGSQQIF